MCRCTHPDCLKGCGCRIKERKCNEDCGCRGKCSNGAPRDNSKEALEALKLNNAILAQLVNLSHLQGGVAIAPQGIIRPPAAAAPAPAPAPVAAPEPAAARMLVPPAPVLLQPSSPPAQHVVVVNGGAVAAVGAGGGNALSLPPTVQPLPARTEYVFWDRLRQAWQNAVVGDLDLMHRLLHPQLMYEVSLTHNGQVMRFAPPNNAQAVVAFCSLFPQAPLCMVHIFPFQSSQQMQAQSPDNLALSYRGPCAYQSLTGAFVIQVLFERDLTFNVHLVRGISIKLEFA